MTGAPGKGGMKPTAVAAAAAPEIRFTDDSSCLGPRYELSLWGYLDPQSM